MVSRRVFAALTVALVLVTSINCFCQASGATTDGIQAARQSGHTCFDNDQDCDHGDSDHCPDHHKKDSDHSCPHCRGTLVSEVSPVKNVTSFLDQSLLVAVLDPIQVNLLCAVQLRLNWADASSPPHFAPQTLLGLHCALTL